MHMIISRSLLFRMRNVSDLIYRGNQNTPFVFSNFYFPFRKSCPLRENVQEYCKAREATGDNTAHAHCILDKYGYRYTLTKCNTYLFPPQQWLLESASLLHYTYTAYLFYQAV